jgi:ribonuclease P protein component
MQTEHLEVRASASLSLGSRIGVVVPKYRHDIVDRNRIRRQLRELARLRLLPALTDTDLLLRAKPAAYQSNFEQLGKEIEAIASWAVRLEPRR